jgi:hypothetical protein
LFLRDKTKSKEKNGRNSFSPPHFFGKKFLTWTFSQKFLNGVFGLPLLRNAQKRHKKISTKNKFCFIAFLAVFLHDELKNTATVFPKFDRKISKKSEKR